MDRSDYSMTSGEGLPHSSFVIKMGVSKFKKKKKRERKGIRKTTSGFFSESALTSGCDFHESLSIHCPQIKKSFVLLVDLRRERVVPTCKPLISCF